MMKNLLLSAAIGDICGSIYEGWRFRTKNYDKVKLMAPYTRFTDDTVCTFACAEALLDGLDMKRNLWERCREHPTAGYGGRFRQWLADPACRPYYSFGNGSAMRCSAAGWMAGSEEECMRMAKETALPTHDHPEGIKGAVATALTVYYLKEGATKEDIRQKVLEKYYPAWAGKTYQEIKPGYTFNSSCQGSVAPAVISFLESRDYVDCIKLAISLGGDADTLAAIAGPMAYAFYREIPDELVTEALDKLPDWMRDVNMRFDEKFAFA